MTQNVDRGTPRSIATAIALIEAERRDLYGQLKALDDALAGLKAIDRDVKPEKIPGERRTTSHNLAQPAHKRKRRAYTTAEKQAGADLARDIGLQKASRQLGIAWGTVRDWRDRFPPAEPTTVPAEWERPDERPDDSTALLLDRVAAGRPLACSCGLTFDDAAGWRAHNESLGLTELRDHRLAVAP
jgi:hypothetical protein